MDAEPPSSDAADFDTTRELGVLVEEGLDAASSAGGGDVDAPSSSDGRDPTGLEATVRRIAVLGTRSQLASGAFVCGDMGGRFGPLAASRASHASICARSYVKPSAARTGSTGSACEIGQTISSASS